MLRLFVLCAISPLLIGCAGIYAAMIGANDIIVFDTPPDRAYDVVSVVFGQDEYIDDAIRSMRIKAAKLNADAIILAPEKPPQKTEPQTMGDNNQIVQVNQSQNMNSGMYSAVVG
jgi:hypothetical protein